MELSLFDYHLPKEAIAQEPARPRDHSRLMVLRGKEIVHDRFFNIARYLEPGDVLVLNDTRVIPARLDGRKGTGGSVEVTLLTPASQDSTGPGPGNPPSTSHTNVPWNCLIKAKKIKAGTEIILDGGWRAHVLEHVSEGEFRVAFHAHDENQDFARFLNEHGRLPLPPYIRKIPEDETDYQTIFAKKDGSVAAPTAGLHFTEQVFVSLKEKGVNIAKVTLHVGPGTFLPVKTERIEEHHMHEEHYTLDSETAGIINEAVEEGGRLVAVGTTTLRVLESVVEEGGEFRKGAGATGLFIYPGYQFRSGIDVLLTNFHLPRSTLLMLVSAFVGREWILRAYEEAKKEGYRFYSFGDAMWLERG